MTYTYEYPRPAVTVDCVVFGLDPNSRRLQVLLIRRGGPPFDGSWALPGGFVNMDESLTDAAARELWEETGVKGVYLEQLRTFGDPGRDPRGRVISVAHVALLPSTDVVYVKHGSDASAAQWFDVGELTSGPAFALAFDHAAILASALERVRAKVRYAPIIFELLPEKFTIAELQTVYETVTGRKIDKRHFRRKVEGLHVLTKKGTRKTGRRPPVLYQFDPEKMKRQLERGQEFYL